MYVHNDQPSGKQANQEQKSKQFKQNSGNNSSAFQLVDNRSEAVAQREMQISMSKAPQTMQLKSWQDLANKSNNSGQQDNLTSSIGEGASPASMMQGGVFQLQGKPVVAGGTKDSDKLSNIVDALFKAAPAGGAVVGDGSALAACSHEKGGGALVGGADHQQKCAELLKGVKKLIKRSSNAAIPAGDKLTAADLVIAQKLKTDLDAAIAGIYAG